MIRLFFFLPAIVFVIYYLALGCKYSFSISVLYVWLCLAGWFLALGCLPRPWFLPLVLITLVAVIFFLIFCLFLYRAQKRAGTGAVDAVLVLGTRTDHTLPESILTKRADLAVKVLKQNPHAVCLLSGGQVFHETEPECRTLLWHLKARGVPSECVILEEQSRTTKENFAFSFALMPQNVLCCAVITSAPHLFRAEKIAFSSRPPCRLVFFGAPVPPLFSLHFAVREMITFTVGALKGDFSLFCNKNSQGGYVCNS